MNGWVSGWSLTDPSAEDDCAFERLTVDFFLVGAFLLVDFFVAIPQVYTLVFKIGLNYNKRNHAKTDT